MIHLGADDTLCKHVISDTGVAERSAASLTA